MRFRVPLAVALPLLWNNWLLPRTRLDHRGRTLANALAATGYAVAFHGRPNWGSGRGLRVGIGCAAVVATGYALAYRLPPVRRAAGGGGDRGGEVGTAEWVAVHIPLGTVYAEELIFRATLDPLLDTAFGAGAGLPAGAAVFGLWHIHPARVAGDSVAATVAFTGVSGLLFGALARCAGSATAPALLHWAVNAGGALLARKAAARVAFTGREPADDDKLRR